MYAVEPDGSSVGGMTNEAFADLLREAVRSSLGADADLRDADLIPGEESFRGLFLKTMPTAGDGSGAGRP